MSESCGLVSKDLPSIPLTGVKVSGDILGRCARVRLIQRFRNPESKPIEAVYKFPLPEGAAVCGFRADVGGRLIKGRIEERDKAFEIYDDALSDGNGAYLLDEERPNLFTLSVGSLPPGAEAAVEIDFVQLLEMEGDKARFLLPTTISPRYSPIGADEPDGIPDSDTVNPPFAPDVPYGLTLELAVHDAASLAGIESPSHPVAVDMSGDPVRVSLSAESTRMDRDFILYLDQGADFEGRARRFDGGEHVYYQLDFRFDPEEAKAAEPQEAPEPTARDTVFLVDCSGSMCGDSIVEARRALEISARALEPGRGFNIVRFGSTFESLFPSPRKYDEDTLKQALDYLGKMDADLGGTEIFRPLSHILEEMPRNGMLDVILLTDGQVGNENQVFGLVRGHSASARVFSIGIGAGCNEYFIRGLARAGDGASEFIYPGERVEPKVLRLFRRMTKPLLRDVAILWGEAGALQAPGSITASAAEPVSVFARFPAGRRPEGPIEVQGRVEDALLTWSFDPVPVKGEDFPLPVFWARAAIRDLEEGMEEGAKSGSRQAKRKSKKADHVIVKLSKQAGLLSTLTSFVAVEERKEKDKTTGEIVLRKVPVPVTVGWHGLGSVTGALNLVSESRPDQAVYLCMDSPPLYGGRDARAGGDDRHGKFPLFSSVPDSMADGIPDGDAALLSGDASSPSAPSRSVDPDLDIVLAILDTQQAEGGMLLTPELVDILGIDLEAVRREAESLDPGDADADAFMLLSTALLLEVLEKRFASRKAVWGDMTEKSRKWLERTGGSETWKKTIGNERLH